MVDGVVSIWGQGICTYFGDASRSADIKSAQIRWNTTGYDPRPHPIIFSLYHFTLNRDDATESNRYLVDVNPMVIAVWDDYCRIQTHSTITYWFWVIWANSSVVVAWCYLLEWYLKFESIIGAFMMTSSNGNIFRITSHLCGEFTGLRWIPRTKASDAELWCFLWSVSK